MNKNKNNLGKQPDTYLYKTKKAKKMAIRYWLALVCNVWSLHVGIEIRLWQPGQAGKVVEASTGSSHRGGPQAEPSVGSSSGNPVKLESCGTQHGFQPQGRATSRTQPGFHPKWRAAATKPIK